MSDTPFHVVRNEDRSDHGRSNRRKRLDGSVPPAGLRSLAESAGEFLLDPELETALNMAITVGAPLLLTGEAGTGKTQVAHFVAWYFGIKLFQFHVKSTSTATDMKYDFDAVAYLRYAQTQSAAEKPRDAFLQKRALWLAYECDGPSVVLIDEIDKASRDFPNDLLHELDQHSFPHPFHPETSIERKSGRPPIVIVTSNAERRLPDAFLRRCIFHHIELRDDVVRRIVEQRWKSLFPSVDRGVLDRAIEIFFDLRGNSSLSKKPGTAELLTWLAILAARGTKTADLATIDARLPAVTALIKDFGDLGKLR